MASSAVTVGSDRSENYIRAGKTMPPVDRAIGNYGLVLTRATSVVRSATTEESHVFGSLPTIRRGTAGHDQSLLQPNLGHLTGHRGDVAPTSVKGVGNCQSISPP
jgi:hypothetical protein